MSRARSLAGRGASFLRSLLWRWSEAWRAGAGSHNPQARVSSVSEPHGSALPAATSFFSPRNENKSLVVEATIILDFQSHSVTLILTKSHLFASKWIKLSNTSKCQLGFQTTPVNGEGFHVKSASGEPVPTLCLSLLRKRTLAGSSGLSVTGPQPRPLWAWRGFTGEEPGWLPLPAFLLRGPVLLPGAVLGDLQAPGNRTYLHWKSSWLPMVWVWTGAMECCPGHQSPALGGLM